MSSRSRVGQGFPEVFPTSSPAPRSGTPAGASTAATAASLLFLGSVAVLAVAGLAALLAHQTLLFPSLGPTAMLFFARPLPPECSVGTTVVAHIVGILLGFLCLLVFGLQHSGASVASGITPARVAAAALSVGLTAATLRLIRSPHAPAGASTLIVSLGVLTTPMQLLMMGASVVLVAIAGWAVNACVGVRVPLWPDRRTGVEVGEQMPVPWRPAAQGPDSATRLLPLPGHGSSANPYRPDHLA